MSARDEREMRPLRARIAVLTGGCGAFLFVTVVLAANIGGGDRLTYSLVGDTVNVASRLQGLNKKFGTKILISGDTLAEIDEPVSVKQMPPTPIKGKSKPVDIFALS